MRSIVILSTLAVLFFFAAAAPQDYEDEADVQKKVGLAQMIESALKQALVQSALEDEDEANLQNILAEAEQVPDDDDELNKAQLMKFIANMQGPSSNAHSQWWRRAWRRIRRPRRRRRWSWRWG